jgi:hypothetical protein
LIETYNAVSLGIFRYSNIAHFLTDPLNDKRVCILITDSDEMLKENHSLVQESRTVKLAYIEMLTASNLALSLTDEIVPVLFF